MSPLTAAFAMGLVLQWTALGMQRDACRRGGGVDSDLLSPDQILARELQYDISCTNDNAARDLFHESVLQYYGHEASEEYHAHKPTLENSLEVCRASSCGEEADITWCIDVYHPTETIRICMGRGGVINQTEYARLLQLQCYFSIPGPEVECPGGDHCISIRQPEHLLDRSILTCSLNNTETNCRSKAFTILEVHAIGTESRLPQPVFENTTELVLGETNIFLCTVYFRENTAQNGIFARWHIDDVPVHKIHENPFCSESERNCSRRDFAATTRENRIRAYEEKRAEARCPYPLLFYKEWLWIDNATAEDARHNYTCVGESVFFNPFRIFVRGVFDVTFTAVLPVLDVSIIEVPDIVFSQPEGEPVQLTLEEGGEFQWPCVVRAGLGDQLQWLLNDEVITTLSINESLYSENVECSLEELGSLYVVTESAENLGGFAREYSSRLVACNLNQSFAGVYQCRLNRSRDEPIEVWSTTISVASLQPESPAVASLQTGLYAGVTIASLVLLVVFLAVVILWFRCSSRHRKRGRLDVSGLNSLGLFSTSLGVEESGRPFNQDKSLVKEELTPCFSDPLEFPRDKLIMTDTELGKGRFGRVLLARAEGIVRDSPGRNIVAVKECQKNAPRHQFMDFWEELQLMKQLEPHENIVNLLGHCTKYKPPGPVYLIMEYAMYRDLKGYLLQCKEMVEKLNHRPLLAGFHRKTLSSTTSSGCPATKIPLSQQSSVFSEISHNCPSPDLSNPRGRCLTQDSGIGGDAALLSAEVALDYTNCKGLLYMEDVMDFAHQIACGLQHLQQQKIIHCDLASRNVLVAEGYVLKIGDFGMACKATAQQQRRREELANRIPVKWSAPEVINELIFSHKSDIWSFGVILWEILTYGQDPYSDQKISHSLDHFSKFLEAGNRLPCPESCPSNIYDFMLSCWHYSPEQRPLAADLVQFLSDNSDDAASDDLNATQLSLETKL